MSGTDVNHQALPQSKAALPEKKSPSSFGRHLFVGFILPASFGFFLLSTKAATKCRDTLRAHKAIRRKPRQILAENTLSLPFSLSSSPSLPGPLADTKCNLLTSLIFFYDNVVK